MAALTPCPTRGPQRPSTLDLAGGGATGDEIGFDLLTGIENAFGGLGDDYLYGDGAANQLVGGDGHDVIHGRGGNDHLLGGSGNDILRPGAGNDTVDGGDDVDRVDYSDLALSWTIDLSAGTAVSAPIPVIGAYHQTLSRVEDVTMGDGNDTVYGDAGSNRIVGLDGHDFSTGAAATTRSTAATAMTRSTADRATIGCQVATATIRSCSATSSQLATVADFTDGSDLIGLDMTLYVSFDDLAIEADADGNAVIYMGPRQITLVGVSITAIDNSDFIWL